MICLELNWFVYDQSWMLQLSGFIWTLRSLAWVVFNNFLRIDATDRSKISSDQKRLFFAVSLCPLSFFCEHSLWGLHYAIVQKCNLLLIAQTCKIKLERINKHNVYAEINTMVNGCTGYYAINTHFKKRIILK